MTQQPRRRDPEARRTAIVAATAELITEVGVDAITHRMVAARAEVPLGATTQYFATLDDLREAALHLLVSQMDEQMRWMREAIAERGATPAILTEIILGALADARAMHADRAVVTAAVHDPRLRSIARGLSQQLIDMLEQSYDQDRALAASVLLDGILWHTLIHDEPLPYHTIEMALTGILASKRT